MKSLKEIVRRRLLLLTAVMMVMILLIAVFFQVISIQTQVKGNAEATFIQVSQVIEKNKEELKAIKAEYENTCLLNAEAISYIIDHRPDLLETSLQRNGKGEMKEIGTPDKREAFRTIANMLEVDEIHIFDTTGCIFTGTHLEYTGYTFDDGEQIGFFKPLLDDKRLELCQDITPNTADGRIVQYSARWSIDGNYIVQVGMYPDAVLEVTEKNELSYIFSLLRGNPGVLLYAVDSESGNIVGSNAGIEKDTNISAIGLSLGSMGKYKHGAHVNVNGVNSFCIFEEIDGTYIGYIISNDQMYGNVGMYTFMMSLGLVIVAIVLVIVVMRFTDKYIIGSISATNGRLRAVTEGDLGERVDVQSSQEFSELSSYINSMIRSLLAETDKMSLVLNRTNLHIGVYEYNTKMKSVRFTEHIPEIFGLNSDEMAKLSSDYRNLREFINQLCREPIADAENTYRFEGKTEMYIKLEEVTNGSEILGIVMDVTEETLIRKRAEAERDHDQLTGLYNRRGMSRAFEKLFSSSSEMGSGALIMIDSDNLKVVNDTYGHAAGDEYLKQLAYILQNFTAPKLIAARTGGDEFVLLIYGYKNDTEAKEAVRLIGEYQDKEIVTLANGTKLPLYFSYGYELTKGRADYELMLSAADFSMYNSKRERKKAYKKIEN